jgi:hypothetical protein
MSKDITEIGVVLDRSGSMADVKSDAIGGFNTFLDGQKKAQRESRITLAQFDHEYDLVHDGKPTKDVPPLTEETYIPRGTTALLDAIGRTIEDMGRRLDKMPESERPARVLVAILTDGLENASKDYTREKINSMIAHQREVYSWEFLFLAANQNAIQEGSKIGVLSHGCISTQSTSAGNMAVGEALNSALAYYEDHGASLRGSNLQQSYDAAVEDEEQKAK